jgi:hypothetical protein
VGGSGPGNNSRFDSSNQLHQVNSILFQCTIQHHHGQRDKLHFKGIQELLRRTGNQAQICICGAPEDKWASQKANDLICSGIKKRLLAPLKKAKSVWIDELPFVLWSLRTTPNAATQETPFFLVHGAEAVLPVEITHEAPRVMAYDEITSTEALQDDVDALDEARDKALERATQYQ